MKITVFGLTMTSSWGNGHATLWRGLCRGLVRLGHRVRFYEKDAPYYAAHRDWKERADSGVDVCLYDDWRSIESQARADISDSDTVILTSYCPDARRASPWIEASKAIRIYYDLDTPVSLARLKEQGVVDYYPEGGFHGYDLVLSYTGGYALDALTALGARRVKPLYGSVDPDFHFKVEPSERYRCDLSYLGTYAKDRQEALDELFLRVADMRPNAKLFLAGSMYPESFPWRKNIHFTSHLSPEEHPSFYSSSRLTLNITRRAMKECGYCPSGRFFEAAACGAPVITDEWAGLDEFFTPGKEIFVARSARDVAHALDLSDWELRRIGEAARERALASHTALRRAVELESWIGDAMNERGAGASGVSIWGIVPAAGAGTRIQPLAFSKELLPVGSRIEAGVERPRAVSEYLMDRMLEGGAKKICLVISPAKSDLVQYYGATYTAGERSAEICYSVQAKPGGLCDAFFRPSSLIPPSDVVLLGLPDTVWFPSSGFRALPDDTLSLLLFPVDRPEAFDAVVTDEYGRVQEIDVKCAQVRSFWIWGAMKFPGVVYHALHALWLERERRDEYLGTLINEYIRRGGRVRAVRAGQTYVDVGTVHGYRQAIQALIESPSDSGPIEKCGDDRAPDLRAGVA